VLNNLTSNATSHAGVACLSLNARNFYFILVSAVYLLTNTDSNLFFFLFDFYLTSTLTSKNGLSKADGTTDCLAYAQAMLINAVHAHH